MKAKTFKQVKEVGLFNIEDRGELTSATFKENCILEFSRGEIIIIKSSDFELFCNLYSVNIDRKSSIGKSSVFYVSKEFFGVYILDYQRTKANGADYDKVINTCWKKCLEWYFNDYYKPNHAYTSFLGKDENFRPSLV